jgi:hypothetical protein
MGSLILTHLGDSVPPYIKDCVHQLRLWNPNLPVYLILDECHRPEATHLFKAAYSGSTPTLWSTLETDYRVKLVYTDTLKKTAHHQHFNTNLKSDAGLDLKFRKGYWQFVKERFFYIEELIQREKLTHTVSMEYDVLVYLNLAPLFQKLAQSHQTLRFVKDNETRGHPGFLYIPNLAAMCHYNQFLVSIMDSGLGDMESFIAYEKKYPERVHYLPVMTRETTLKIPTRKSLDGRHSCSNTGFLYEDAGYLECLFDSAAVGQWVSGIDPRNTGGRKITRYPNEGSLYTVEEVGLEWVQYESKWVPIFDGTPLATIHVHSKALSHLLSDRIPSDEYDVNDVLIGLVPN